MCDRQQTTHTHTHVTYITGSIQELVQHVQAHRFQVELCRACWGSVRATWQWCTRQLRQQTRDNVQQASHVNNRVLMRLQPCSVRPVPCKAWQGSQTNLWHGLAPHREYLYHEGVLQRGPGQRKTVETRLRVYGRLTRTAPSSQPLIPTPPCQTRLNGRKTSPRRQRAQVVGWDYDRGSNSHGELEPPTLLPSPPQSTTRRG